MRILKIAIVAVTICLAAVAAFAQPQGEKEAVSISIKKGNAAIIYDVRLEAIYTILVLCDYDIISPYSTAYQQEIEEHFASWKNTESFKRIKEQSKKGFRFIRPIALAFSTKLVENKLIQVKAMPPFYVSLLGGEAKVQELVADVNAFLTGTDFFSFFAQHKNEYQTYLESQSPYLFEVMSDVDIWYQPKNAQYVAYVSCLAHAGGFNIGFFTKNPTSIIGALRHDNGDIHEYLTYNVSFHEFSHHFVDGYLKKNWQLIEKRLNASIFPEFPVEDTHVYQQEYISESIIRALSNYYCMKKDSTVTLDWNDQYPLAKNIFDTIKDGELQHINEDFLNSLMSIFLKSTEK